LVIVIALLSARLEIMTTPAQRRPCVDAVISSRTVSILRALVIGVALALALIAALFLAGGSSGWIQLVVLVPPLLLGGISLWSSPRGWSTRLARGLLGALLAAIAAVMIILRFPELFPFPADQGADLYVAVLAVIASIPGFTAAASAKPALGRALAVGFVFGLSAPLVLHGEPGAPLLLVAGTLVGAIVACLPAGRSA